MGLVVPQTGRFSFSETIDLESDSESDINNLMIYLIEALRELKHGELKQSKLK